MTRENTLTPISEPTPPLPPITEPFREEIFEELELSPFKRRTAEYWKKVGGDKCQYEFYDDKRGWQECEQPAKHVHHIIPEGWQLDRGGDSERSTGLPLCEQHHVKNKGTEEHSHDFAFHSDMSEAYDKYPEYMNQARHMEHITGQRPTRQKFPSPFEEAASDHRAKSAKGERYWNGTPETDQYYEDKMNQKAMDHKRETGEGRPITQPHPHTDKAKKKHWWDLT